MKIKIAYDLDGVLRDLDPEVQERFGIPEITDWYWKHEGKTIYQLVAQDYSILETCRPTKFLDIVQSFHKSSPIEIWTHQPKDWIPYTAKWLNKYFPNREVYYLTTAQKRKKLDSEPQTLLVEDNPNFTYYERIILIDSLYNRNVNVETRVKSVEEFKKLMQAILI